MGPATSGGTATVPPKRTVHLVRPVLPVMTIGRSSARSVVGLVPRRFLSSEWHLSRWR